MMKTYFYMIKILLLYDENLLLNLLSYDGNLLIYDKSLLLYDGNLLLYDKILLLMMNYFFLIYYFLI